MKIKQNQLCLPSTDMNNTKSANGTKMKCLGYFDTTVKWGDVTTKTQFVCYEDLSEPMLSINTLVELGIVKIQTNPIGEKDNRISTTKVSEKNEDDKKSEEFITEMVHDEESILVDVNIGEIPMQ